MQIISPVDLAPYNTFAINKSSEYLIEVSSVAELKRVYKHPEYRSLPKLIIGKGSNILFTENYEGVVIANRIMGRVVTESELYWHIHLGAGEDWPSIVSWSLDKGYLGLENLALIPGCVGSAPIQNIGAYGLEFKDVCEYVDILCLETFQVKRIPACECEFGYRDSIFKHALYEKSVVVSVGLKLSKHWKPNLNYGPLTLFNPDSVNAQQIFEKVCRTRQTKLPEPRELGNAGSFFKNPIVSHEQYELVKSTFPEVVSYQVHNGVKIAAAWLIENSDLKGKSYGGAQIHHNQPLVIVNKGHADSEDIVQLAAIVYKKILGTYGIELHHEVRFWGSKSETSLRDILGVLP